MDLDNDDDVDANAQKAIHREVAYNVSKRLIQELFNTGSVYVLQWLLEGYRTFTAS